MVAAYKDLYDSCSAPAIRQPMQSDPGIVSIPWRVIAAVVALAGTLVLLYATASGIGLSPDSAAYISAARGLLRGVGLSSPLPDGHYNPMVLYAPLFSMLLAACGLVGIDAPGAARAINVALFAANVLLGSELIKRDTGSTSSAIVGAAGLVIAVPMLKVHSMAWSEPAFIFLSLLSLLWLSAYARNRRVGDLVAAAVTIGLALLSRYAGTFLIGAGVAAVILRRPVDRRTLRDCAILAGISGGIGSVSWIRNWMVAGTFTGHPAALHPVTLMHLEEGLDTIRQWLAISPGPRRLPAALLVVGGFIWAVMSLEKYYRPNQVVAPRHHETDRSAVARTAVVFITGYIVFLLAAISFFDAPTPLDDRILCPMLVWGLLGAVAGGYHLLARWPWRTGPWLVLVGIWFAVAQLLQAVPWAMNVHRDGQGYASAAWRESDILARVQAFPPATRIFSNGDDAIYLLTGRVAERVPEHVSPTTMRPGLGYEAEFDRMRAKLTNGSGVVVYFSRIDWRPHLTSIEELRDRLSMRTLYSGSDGIVMALDGSSGEP